MFVGERQNVGLSDISDHIEMHLIRATRSFQATQGGAYIEPPNKQKF